MDNFFRKYIIINIMNNQSKKNKMDIVDVEKLYAQHQAGFSIRKLSIIWNLSYASLYRALKGREEEKKESKNV